MFNPARDRWSRNEALAALDVAVQEMAKERVLLVEDHEAMRTFLTEVLTHEGYDVLSAANGVEALAVITRDFGKGLQPGQLDPIPIRVVITDHRMPGITGLELVEHLRHLDWHPSVILVSAFADQQLRQEAGRLGAAAVLTKPFAVRDLLDTVARLLPRS